MAWHRSTSPTSRNRIKAGMNVTLCSSTDHLARKTKMELGSIWTCMVSAINIIFEKSYYSYTCIYVYVLMKKISVVIFTTCMRKLGQF